MSAHITVAECAEVFERLGVIGTYDEHQLRAVIVFTVPQICQIFHLFAGEHKTSIKAGECSAPGDAMQLIRVS